MDVGLLIPLAAPFASREFVELLGRNAESCGFTTLWVGEHVVVPDEWESLYPASQDGNIPDAIRKGELDPLTTLSYLSAITKNLRLGACCNVAQRNPVYTAKEATNVDWLSGGRLEFGAGVGWAAEEFQACGIPFENRGSRARSHLQVMQRLWASGVAEYEDEFYSLRPSLLYPKPVQEPRLPIHILGDSNAALLRVADFGDGFLPLEIEPADLEAKLTKLDGLLAERSRKRDEITVSVIPPSHDLDLEKVRRYQDAGADRIIIMRFVSNLNELVSTIDRLAEQIVVPAASL